MSLPEAASQSLAVLSAPRSQDLRTIRTEHRVVDRISVVNTSLMDESGDHSFGVAASQSLAVPSALAVRIQRRPECNAAIVNRILVIKGSNAIPQAASQSLAVLSLLAVRIRVDCLHVMFVVHSSLMFERRDHFARSRIPELGIRGGSSSPSGFERHPG